MTEFSKHDLSCEINDNGGWEEFHQKAHNFTMYDHHKATRLKLKAEYDRRFSNDTTKPNT